MDDLVSAEIPDEVFDHLMSRLVTGNPKSDGVVRLGEKGQVIVKKPESVREEGERSFNYALLPDDETVAALTESEAEALWLRIRWEDGKPCCIHCKGTDFWHVGRSVGRTKWRCKSCLADLTPTTRTPFSSLKSGLKTVLRVVAFALHNNGKESLRAASRRTKIGPKTFYLLHCKAQEMFQFGIERRTMFLNFCQAKRGPTANRGDLRKNETGIADLVIRSVPVHPTLRRRIPTATALISAPVVETTALGLLEKPRAPFPGLMLTGTRWTDQDRYNLSVLAKAKITADAAGVALGRSAKSIAWYARDLIPYTDIPRDWKLLIAPNRLIVPATPRLFVYPYLPSMPKLADTNGAQLTMDVTALVSRAFPNWMRADICQTILLAILEGAVALDDLRGDPGVIRDFYRKYRRDQVTLPGVGGFKPDRRSSLDAPRYEDDDTDAHSMTLPAGIIGRLEW